MFLLRVAAIVAAFLFCLRAEAQCKNGRCYRPAFSTTPARYLATSGRVTRTRTQLPDGTWGPWKPAKGGDPKSAAAPAKVVTGLLPGEVNRDSRAYAHAKREAQMLANSGNGGWHPLGTAPGCSFSGCGQSSTGLPRHCYANTSPHRIVARASVFRNGVWFWSAHFR